MREAIVQTDCSTDAAHPERLVTGAAGCDSKTPRITTAKPDYVMSSYVQVRGVQLHEVKSRKAVATATSISH